MTLPRHDINLPPGSPASDREGQPSPGHDGPLCAVCGAHVEEIDGERGVCPNCDVAKVAPDSPPLDAWWVLATEGCLNVALATNPRVVGAVARLTIHRTGGFIELHLTPAELVKLLKAVAAADVEVQRRRAAALRAVEDAKASAPAGEEPDLDF